MSLISECVLLASTAPIEFEVNFDNNWSIVLGLTRISASKNIRKGYSEESIFETIEFKALFFPPRGNIISVIDWKYWHYSLTIVFVSSVEPSEPMKICTELLCCNSEASTASIHSAIESSSLYAAMHTAVVCA